MEKAQATHLALWEEGQNNAPTSAPVNNTTESLPTAQNNSEQKIRTKIRNQRRRETGKLLKNKLKATEAALALAQPTINKAVTTATAFKTYADEANRTLSDARRAHPEFAFELKVKPPTLNPIEPIKPLAQKPVTKKPKKCKKKKTLKTVDKNNNNNTKTDLSYYRKQEKPIEIVEPPLAEVSRSKSPVPPTVPATTNVDADDLPASNEQASKSIEQQNQKRIKSGLKRRMTEEQKQDVRFFKSRKQELLKKGEWENSEEKVKYANLKRDILILHISKVQHGGEKPLF